MSRARDIIIRPIITEKTSAMADKNNTIVFEVRKDSNKIEIKKAIEEIYNVKVEKVNTSNVDSKSKRVGKYLGKTKAYKKAMVKLVEGNQIDLYK